MSNFNARFPPKPANKRSIFERQRAEAEAKRQRDNAETAAVYEDFVKSFDDGGDNGQAGHAACQDKNESQSQTPLKSSITTGSVGGRRHFSIPSSSGTPAQRSSGPGSLGPVPGPGGSSTDRRGKEQQPGRTLQNLQRLQKQRAFDESDDDSDEEGQVQEKTTVRKRHDESTAAERAEERAAAKPTIRLANMPPGTSPATIKALITNNSNLVVDGVRILPAVVSAAAPSGAPATDRKALAAIVTLAAETPASEIDATVSALQNRYLGFGYYLNLHRHLSSAVASSSAAAIASTASSSLASSSIAAHTSARPFGARPVAPAPHKDGAASSPAAGFAPPPSYNAGGGSRFSTGYHGRGVPPPPSYNGPSAATAATVSRDGILHVPVRAPGDIKTLRMIHKVVEHVLAQGHAFEALLMSRPEVQREEKWAWIWDARSEAGVWYRYRLWQTVSGLKTKRGQGPYMPVFEGSHAWKMPDHPLPYEFDTSLAELVSDSAYDSSDDSDDEGRDSRENRENNDQDTFLNPLHKARLVHLLARLPTAMARLRKGDVARITAFAMTHASRGADEVVDTIVSNVERPFAYTRANGANGANTAGSDSDDRSSAQLVAVYVVSDILSSSATSGIRHAWRFRQLFEAALRRRKVFEGLGLLAERLRWGRLRADKWKRSIGLVLSQWEGWSVFPAETQAYLVSSFENALSKAEAAAGTGMKDGASASASAGSAPKKSRWKTVDTAAEAERPFPPEATVPNASMARPGRDDDNEWAYRSDYTDDEALDLACLDDEDIDGVPMDMGSRDSYLDGIALSADEIHALVGSDIAEMSEEGEVGSDDNEEDYDMSFSSEEEPGESGEPVYAARALESSATLAQIQDGGADDTGRRAAPRKRMRAADMFADSN